MRTSFPIDSHPLICSCRENCPLARNSGNARSSSFSPISRSSYPLCVSLFSDLNHPTNSAYTADMAFPPNGRNVRALDVACPLPSLDNNGRAGCLLLRLRGHVPLFRYVLTVTLSIFLEHYLLFPLRRNSTHSAPSIALRPALPQHPQDPSQVQRAVRLGGRVCAPGRSVHPG